MRPPPPDGVGAAGIRLLPPLRLPRALLDPRQSDLPAVSDDGLVAVQLELAEGRIRSIRAAPAALATGRLPLALTPLVEPHAHLDKAFSAAEFPNPAGSMQAAVEVNQREASQRRLEQVIARGERALEMAWRHGVRALRSHVDSLGPGAEPSWEALLSLRQRWAGRVELQLVALVPIAHWLTPEGEALARRVAAAAGLLGGVLGTLPGTPFGARAQDGEALLALLQLAERHGCAVDLHVDESHHRPGRGVAMLLGLQQRHRFGMPVVCSHASSMGLLADRPCRRLAEGLAAEAIGVVALPTTNLWLLGKAPARTPWLRPQAPIRQLQEAGVSVAIGGDNVGDAWYPGGAFDPIELLRLTVLTSHQLPWLRQGLAPFTSAAARLLQLEWDGVLRPGAPADLIVLGVEGWQELLATAPQRRVLRAGHWLPPPEAEQPSPLLRALVDLGVPG